MDKAAVVATLGPSGDDALDRELADITRDEVAKGLLKELLTEAELTQRFGSWLPARRFGIRQGSAVRAIDDYTAAGQNDTVTSTEQLDLGGLDTVVGIARDMLNASAGESFAFELSDGSKTTGAVHSDFTDQGLECLGRTWDLSKAYRQLARSPDQ